MQDHIIYAILLCRSNRRNYNLRNNDVSPTVPLVPLLPIIVAEIGVTYELYSLHHCSFAMLDYWLFLRPTFRINR